MRAKMIGPYMDCPKMRVGWKVDIKFGSQIICTVYGKTEQEAIDFANELAEAIANLR